MYPVLMSVPLATKYGFGMHASDIHPDWWLGYSKVDLHTTRTPVTAVLTSGSTATPPS